MITPTKPVPNAASRPRLVIDKTGLGQAGASPRQHSAAKRVRITAKQEEFVRPSLANRQCSKNESEKADALLRTRPERLMVAGSGSGDSCEEGGRLRLIPAATHSQMVVPGPNDLEFASRPHLAAAASNAATAIQLRHDFVLHERLRRLGDATKVNVFDGTSETTEAYRLAFRDFIAALPPTSIQKQLAEELCRVSCAAIAESLEPLPSQQPDVVELGRFQTAALNISGSSTRGTPSSGPSPMRLTLSDNSTIAFKTRCRLLEAELDTLTRNPGTASFRPGGSVGLTSPMSPRNIQEATKRVSEMKKQMQEKKGTVGAEELAQQNHNLLVELRAVNMKLRDSRAECRYYAAQAANLQKTLSSAFDKLHYTSIRSDAKDGGKEEAPASIPQLVWDSNADIAKILTTPFFTFSSDEADEAERSTSSAQEEAAAETEAAMAD